MNEGIIATAQVFYIVCVFATREKYLFFCIVPIMVANASITSVFLLLRHGLKFLECEQI